jgi:hypothetical protein
MLSLIMAGSGAEQGAKTPYLFEHFCNRMQVRVTVARWLVAYFNKCKTLYNCWLHNNSKYYK